MAQVINEMDVPSHSFVFHGTGERYFLICVVNVLLTIITLGIYLPWALMKCKRYLYANMEVTDNDFLMELLVGMFLLVVLFLFFAISQS
ncbi:DUF898 family protein [Escherichia coli]|uniref:DUF898 family protein n=1 Tax=Escherichia coli TaxID=562 RepID=UPI0021E1056F|nr:DUF898 family protein [Escherichia coli]